MRPVSSNQQSTPSPLTSPPRVTSDFLYKCYVAFEDATFIEAFGDKRVGRDDLPRAIRPAYAALSSANPGAEMSAFKVKVGDRWTYALRADKGGVSNAEVYAATGQKLLAGAAPYSPGGVSGEYGWSYSAPTKG